MFGCCWCVALGALAPVLAWLLWPLIRRARAPSLRERFHDKVVVVTGASSGMGRELALQLAAVGARIVVAARRVDRLDSLVRDCVERGALEAIAVSCDVTDPQQCKAMIAQTEGMGPEGSKGVDAVFVNAGQGALMQMRDVPEEQLSVYKDIMSVNYLGCVYPVYYALPALRRKKGMIVVNSSLAGIGWSPGRTAYSASKHALRGMFNSLRCEEPDVQITIVYPGFVFSEIHDRAKTVHGQKVERNVSHFMSTEEAARSILEGSRLGERDWPLTMQGVLGLYITPFLPALTDMLAIRKAKAGLKNWD